MILLTSVFITDSRITQMDRGGVDPNGNSFEIFLYSLYSMRNIKFSKMIFLIKLDNNYAYLKKTMYSFIHSIFINKNIEIYDYRLYYGRDWRKLYEEKIVDLPEHELIFLNGNHDHVLMSEEAIPLLYHLEPLFQKDKYPYKWACYSHFQENEFLWKNEEIYIEKGTFEDKDEFYYSAFGKAAGGIVITNKQTFAYWWYSEDYGDIPFARPDFVMVNGKMDVNCPRTKVYASKKEIFRHFDAYSHCGISPKVVTPLTIPNNFLNLIKGF